jgi:hypothetical protein
MDFGAGPRSSLAATGVIEALEQGKFRSHSYREGQAPLSPDTLFPGERSRALAGRLLGASQLVSASGLDQGTVARPVLEAKPLTSIAREIQLPQVRLKARLLAQRIRRRRDPNAIGVRRTHKRRSPPFVSPFLGTEDVFPSR